MEGQIPPDNMRAPSGFWVSYSHLYRGEKNFWRPYGIYFTSGGSTAVRFDKDGVSFVKGKMVIET
jgi:hypothetical protein